MYTALTMILYACENHASASHSAGDGQPQLQQTLDSLQEALLRDTGDATARIKLAQLLSSMERRKEALIVLDEGIRSDSGNPAFWNVRAKLQLVWGDSVSAKSSLEQSLRADPSQVSVWLKLGFLHAGEPDGRTEGIAQNLLSQADPEIKAQAWYLLGVHYGNRSETAAAMAAYDSCIVLNYTFIDAHIEKGILLFEKGRYPDALKTFSLASAIDKSNADAWYWQGECLEALGKKEEAGDAYLRSMALDSSLKAAKRGLDRISSR